MLLEITDDAQTAALGKESSSLRARDALEILLRAHREGKHIAYFDRIRPELLSNRHLSESARGTMLGVRNKRAELAGLRRELTIRAKICSGASYQIEESDGASIHNVGIEWFAGDTARALEATLLCENLDDALIWQKLAESRVSHNRWKLQIACDPRGGGGSTTSQELSAIMGRQRIVVCIVDSDRGHPFAEIGATARGVMDAARTAKVLYVVVVLDCRELENILPLSLIDLISGSFEVETRDAVAKLSQAAASSGARDWYPYIDLKSGLRGHDLRQHKVGDPAHRFWSRIVGSFPEMSCALEQISCVQRQSCRCILVPGLGERFASHLLAVLRKTTAQKVTEMCRFDDNEGLTRVVDKLIAVSCALPPSRT